MIKNYLGWYKLKIALEKREFDGPFREREVWWCSIGTNIGHEENGKHSLHERPVLIFRKFGVYTFLGIPLSTARRTGSYYYEVQLTDKEPNILLLAQARVLSTKRLQRRVGMVSTSEFNHVIDAFQLLLPEKRSPV